MTKAIPDIYAAFLNVCSIDFFDQYSLVLAAAPPMANPIHPLGDISITVVVNIAHVMIRRALRRVSKMAKAKKIKQKYVSQYR